MNYRKALEIEVKQPAILDQQNLGIEDAMQIVDTLFNESRTEFKRRKSCNVAEILGSIHTDLKSYWAQFGFLNTSKENHFVDTLESILHVREFKTQDGGHGTQTSHLDETVDIHA
jgi:hypothetical protein